MLSTSVLGAEAVNRVGLDGENKLIAAGQLTVGLTFYTLENLKWNDYIT